MNHRKVWSPRERERDLLCLQKEFYKKFNKTPSHDTQLGTGLARTGTNTGTPKRNYVGLMRSLLFISCAVKTSFCNPCTSLSSKSPQKPRGVTQSTCVMHALRAGRGAHCASVFVRRPSLPGDACSFILQSLDLWYDCERSRSQSYKMVGLRALLLAIGGMLLGL